jgi:molecular chaperone DnaJ
MGGNPFEQYWNGANPFQSGDFSSFFGGQRKTQEPMINKGRNINTIVALTLEEMMTGTNKKVKLNRRVHCDPCKGTGAEKADVINCSVCGGIGRVNKTVHYQFGEMVTQETCRSCGGHGTKPRNVCNSCSGTGTIRKEEEVDFNIPKGSISGVSYVLAAKGDWSKAPSNPGDLVITVEEYAHPVYRRDGVNLISERYISFKEICLGTEIDLPNLLGSSFRIKVPPGTQPGKIFRIKGKGLPEFNGFGFGDILVQVNVKIPELLTEEQMKAIEHF